MNYAISLITVNNLTHPPVPNSIQLILSLYGHPSWRVIQRVDTTVSSLWVQTQGCFSMVLCFLHQPLERRSSLQLSLSQPNSTLSLPLPHSKKTLYCYERIPTTWQSSVVPSQHWALSWSCMFASARSVPYSTFAKLSASALQALGTIGLGLKCHWPQWGSYKAPS